MHRSYKIMPSTFWYISFEDTSTSRTECESSSVDSLPTLKLLGPKLYLVVGRWNITIYSIHPFMDILASSLPLWVILSRNEAPIPSCSLKTRTPLLLSFSHCRRLCHTDLWKWLLHVKTCPNLHVQDHYIYIYIYIYIYSVFVNS